MDRASSVAWEDGRVEKGATARAEPGQTLRIQLLGNLSVARGDRQIAVDAPRLQSLLAYLLLHPGPQPREHLAFRFWPDSVESQARTNLRQTLHLLRRVLPEADRFLDTEARTVSWRADAPFSLDVEDFERLTADAEAAREAGDLAGERSALEAAAAVYAGDLLPGCYDEWLADERERLREGLLRAAERLAELLELERDYRGAIPWARRLLDDDPVNEDACARLMRLHALNGDRAGALRVYHGCATALVRELGVSPGAAIQETYARLLESETAIEPHESAEPAGARLVGRGEEWETLRAGWERAAGGESILVLVAGEAGMGKSRLVQELQEWVEHQGFPTAYSRCYSAAGSLAYAPVAELLRSDAIGPRIAGLDDHWLAELARLVPELASARPGLVAAPPLIDDWQRARLLDAVSSAVLAGERPLLLVIDDLQWCDRETLGWLNYLLESKPRAPLLVIATARIEDLGPEHPVQPLLRATRGSGQSLELELGPLDAAETATLAASVSGRTLGEEREERLHRETEGNPLFVVEWVRAGLVDEGPPHAAEPTGGGHPIPPRAQSVIEARLAQLSPPAQELASLAATVGRAFRFELLAGASWRREEQVVEALDELWRRRIVRDHGVDGYDFSHDKLREAAYRRVGSARRGMLHRRVAQAIERLHGADLDAVSGRLAAHYEQAGWLGRSVDFYARAAALAQGVYANEEAVELLTRALDLLEQEPHGRERAARELILRTALGVALVVHRGYGTPEVTAAYTRAWELCEELGEPPTAPVLRGTGLSALTRGELRRAQDLAGQLLELGERDDDPMVRVEGDYLLGVTAFWLGELDRAREHLERAIASYVPDRARSHLALYSQDPRVVCVIRLAYTLWHLGHPEAASERAAEALNLAEGLEHPFSLGYALTFASWLALDSGDEDLAGSHSERVAELADERQLGFLQPIGTILRGWRLVAAGDPNEGIATIGEGIDVYRRSGQPLYLPWSLRLLAEVCLRESRSDEAGAALAEAFDVVENTEQRFLEADLHRLQGELALAAGNTADAESRFATALEIARGQGAAPLERQAAAGLDRLRER
jgi:DNA-binding SARP family transcriptional activator